MSHHGRAPKKRGLSPVQCPCLVRGPATASTARHACAARACVLRFSSRETACAVARTRVPRAEAGWFLKAVAGMSHRGRALKERGLSPVQLYCALSLPSAWTDHDQCGTVRARRKLACCASSAETEKNSVAKEEAKQRRVLGDDVYDQQQAAKKEEKAGYEKHRRDEEEAKRAPWRARACHAKAG